MSDPLSSLPSSFSRTVMSFTTVRDTSTVTLLFQRTVVEQVWLPADSLPPQGSSRPPETPPLLVAPPVPEKESSAPQKPPAAPPLPTRAPSETRLPPSLLPLAPPPEEGEEEGAPPLARNDPSSSRASTPQTNNTSSPSAKPTVEMLLQAARALRFLEQSLALSMIKSANQWLRDYLSYSQTARGEEGRAAHHELARTYDQIKKSVEEALPPAKEGDAEYQKERETLQELLDTLSLLKAPPEKPAPAPLPTSSSSSPPSGKAVGSGTTLLNAPAAGEKLNGPAGGAPAGTPSPTPLKSGQEGREKEGGVNRVSRTTPKETQQLPPPASSDEKASPKEQRNPLIQVQEHMQDCEKQLKELLDTAQGEPLTELVRLLLDLVSIQNQQISLLEEEVEEAQQGYPRQREKQEEFLRLQKEKEESFLILERLLATYSTEESTSLVQLLLHILNVQKEEISLLKTELTALRRG